MHDFVRILITRLYNHWSCDDFHLYTLMNEMMAYFEKSLEYSSYGNGNELSPQKNSFAVTPLKKTIESINQITSPESRVTTSPIIDFVQMVYSEICRSAELISFIRYISDSITPTGRSVISTRATPEISVICSHIIEPICQRFALSASECKIPSVLRIAIGVSMKCQFKTKAIALFSDCIIPRIVRWIFGSGFRDSTLSTDNSNKFRPNLEDQALLSDYIQELLKMCFGKGNAATYTKGDNANNVNGNTREHIITLSLSHSAMLSRSKWLISR
jgi:hypothetical protein